MISRSETKRKSVASRFVTTRTPTSIQRGTSGQNLSSAQSEPDVRARARAKAASPPSWCLRASCRPRTPKVNARFAAVFATAVISKDAEGNVLLFEAGELMDEVGEALAELEGEHDDLLSEEDLLMAAEDLPNNSTAAAMLFENVWAARFAQAVRNAGGEVLVNVRVPHDIVEAVQEMLA